MLALEYVLVEHVTVPYVWMAKAVRVSDTEVEGEHKKSQTAVTIRRTSPGLRGDGNSRITRGLSWRAEFVVILIFSFTLVPFSRNGEDPQATCIAHTSLALLLCSSFSHQPPPAIVSSVST